MAQQVTNQVAIIGGGVAGLTAAVYLAKNGRNVTVYEQSKKVGGRARTADKEGVLFNMGGHALYVGGAADKTFQELGLHLPGKRPVFAKSIGVRDGTSHILPGSPAELFKTSLFTFGEKGKLAGCLMKLQNASSENFRDTTWQEWVESTTSSARVQEFLFALSRLFTYTNHPDLVSAQIILNQMQMGLKDNVRYLDQGWQTIVQALKAKIKEFGGEIITGARVSQIDAAGRLLTLADGTQASYEAVVLAIDPQTAAGLLPQSKHLASFVNRNIPIKAAALNLAFSKLPVPENQFLLGIDHSSYFSIHSDAAKLAPEGTIVAHLMKYYPAGDEDGEKALVELEADLDLIQPGWRSYVVARSYLPSMTTVNHLPTAAQNGYAGRPAVQLAEHDGLYLAGDWVGDEGWLIDASVASGRKAADMIHHHLPVRNRPVAA